MLICIRPEFRSNARSYLARMIFVLQKTEAEQWKHAYFDIRRKKNVIYDTCIIILSSSNNVYSLTDALLLAYYSYKTCHRAYR